jgi:hypothetical protein
MARSSDGFRIGIPLRWRSAYFIALSLLLGGAFFAPHDGQFLCLRGAGPVAVEWLWRAVHGGYCSLLLDRIARFERFAAKFGVGSLPVLPSPSDLLGNALGGASVLDKVIYQDAAVGNAVHLAFESGGLRQLDVGFDLGIQGWHGG